MKMDHLGIAVHNIAEAAARFGVVADEGSPDFDTLESQKVRVAFVKVGSAHLEFLEPTDPSSTVARFLATRGEGIHHVAFHVASVDAALKSVSEQGGRLVDRTGRPGARGRIVGFAHPSAFHGVLVEFVEGS